MPIRRLTPTDAADFLDLRLQALQECPAAFSSSYEEECATPVSVIEGHLAPDSGRNMFGAFAGTELIGLVGIGRETARKLRHKGFIRGMYVAPTHRRAGIGRQLLDHALTFAASLPELRQLTLVVSAGNVSARRLYEAAGFRVYGVEPAAMLVDGVSHDDVLMMRPLTAPAEHS